MSLPKFILFGSVLLFIAIGAVGVVQKISRRSSADVVKTSTPAPAPKVVVPAVTQKVPVKASPAPVAAAPAPASATARAPVVASPTLVKEDFPVVDRIFQLFTTGPNKLPIVETVTYSSSVPWLKGRPAWIADYASHYETSRHFIARSLNGRPDYLTQTVSTGSHFNVFRSDKKIQFYLVIDLSRLKMGFYYLDLDTQERMLLKTYSVGLGKLDPDSSSGCLTPLGTYSLGSKIAIYKPGTMGFFHEQKAEMIRVFGTRWIPFDREFEDATAPAKGLGLHGAPWREDPKTGTLIENCSPIGAYESDGSICLAKEDIEELFSIIITKPTFVVIVKNFHEAKLPGTEVVSK